MERSDHQRDRLCRRRDRPAAIAVMSPIRSALANVVGGRHSSHQEQPARDPLIFGSGRRCDLGAVAAPAIPQEMAPMNVSSRDSASAADRRPTELRLVTCWAGKALAWNL